MKVLVYVEGPADRAALEVLLDPVIGTGRENGIGIRFLQQGGKATILSDVGRKAAEHILEYPNDWVFAVPDLHPMSVFDGTPNGHRSFDELKHLLWGRFSSRATKLGMAAAAQTHFRIHCLKYDLEALLPAASDALRSRLDTDDLLRNRWRLPVEDQDDNRPPKRIVEDLFMQYRKKPGYVATIDAPWILKRASLAEILAACPQRFTPLVNELRMLATGGTLPYSSDHTKTSAIIYRSEPHRALMRNFKVFSALHRLADLTAPIPNHGEHLARNHG